MSPTDRQPDGEPTAPAHTVPKWPFVFGDMVLVASALAMWATQPQLSDRQLLFCLGAVAAGACLFTLPYLLEHFARSQEYVPPPEGSFEAERQRLAAFEGDLRRQARAATEALEQAARANAAFEGSARRFETRLAPLAEIQKRLEATASELRDAAARPPAKDNSQHERELSRLREEHAEKFKAAEARLVKLSEAVAALAAQLENLASRPSAPPPESSASVARKPETAEGGSMLAKALATAQPAEDAPAVAGIIQSRPRRPRKPKLPENGDTAAPPPAAEPGDPAAPMDVAAPVEAAASVASPPSAPRADWDSLAEGKFDQVTSAVEVAPEQAGSAVAIAEPPPATQAAPAEKFVTETKSARAKAAALRDDDDDEQASAAPAGSKTAEPATEPAQGELLAGAAESTRKQRRGKSSVEATALVARVLIGIGNKPYVRGDGPGLSPTKGVPMEFVEIGKWQWVAPAPAKSPVRLQILKNDEVPADGEPIVLQPGQNLEVSPVFPS